MEARMIDSDRLRVNSINGRLRIEDAAGLPVLDGAWAAAVLEDGTTFTTEGAEPVTAPDGWRLSAPGGPARPELRWTATREGNGLVLTLELVNTLHYALSVDRLDVLVAPHGFLGADARRLAVAQTGWQSWSFASPPVPLSQHARAGTAPKIAPGLPNTDAERVVVPWATILRAGKGARQAAEPAGSPSGDRPLLLGFVDARTQQGTITVQPTPGGHRLTASSHAEGRRVAPGETWRSEPLLLLLDLPDETAWGCYAEALTDRMPARRPATVSTGWSSWYYFFTSVSEADVTRNLATLVAHRDRMPVDVVQLDDGYQTAIGDWLSLNDKFPSGMRALTDAIHAHGFEAGLWLAPFTVGENSEIYAQHPEWVLRDANGEPINTIHNWDTRNFGLDTTHPGVEAHLREVFGTIVNDWNFDYLKIDFIYGACLRARRHDPQATSVQAYRRGLEIIREVVGDRFVLGCGAPFAPSVGLVDGMRVGPDTAPDWAHPDLHGAEPSLLNAIRSTLAHGWMHRRWYVNDPDCLIVRRENSNLTPAEVETWASVVALSGGMVILSDDLSQLEPDRADIIPRLLPPSGEAAQPVGPAIGGVPTGMQWPVERSWERWLVAGLFNWTEETRPLVFDPLAWDMPAGRGAYHLFDLWRRTHMGPQTGPVLLAPTAPHGVRLLSVHQDLGRPQLVGSTFHLLGEAIEVVEETWADETLTLRLAGPGERRGEIYVYVPGGWDVAEAPAGALARGRLVELPFRYRGAEVVTLRFKRVPA
jgi:alpha-galactosidase